VFGFENYLHLVLEIDILDSYIEVINVLESFYNDFDLGICLK